MFPERGTVIQMCNSLKSLVKPTSPKIQKGPHYLLLVAKNLIALHWKSSIIPIIPLHWKSSIIHYTLQHGITRFGVYLSQIKYPLLSYYQRTNLLPSTYLKNGIHN